MLPDAFANRHIMCQDLHDSLTYDHLKTVITPALEEAIIWMEKTGGEPVVVSLDGRWAVVDGATESPKARTKCCYDYASRVGRKRNAPEKSAIEQIPSHLNLHLMTEEEYFSVQTLIPLDLKTSSWLYTPHDVRSAGGALFGDRRFGRVFIYHNSADSYYSSRGFRCVLPLEI